MENDLKTKGLVSKIHKMNKVIGCNLAYVAVQVCLVIFEYESVPNTLDSFASSSAQSLHGVKPMLNLTSKPSTTTLLSFLSESKRVRRLSWSTGRSASSTLFSHLYLTVLSDILQNIVINTGDADVDPTSRYALLMAESKSELEEEGSQPGQSPAAPTSESNQPSAPS